MDPRLRFLTHGVEHRSTADVSTVAIKMYKRFLCFFFVLFLEEQRRRSSLTGSDQLELPKSPVVSLLQNNSEEEKSLLVESFKGTFTQCLRVRDQPLV